MTFAALVVRNLFGRRIRSTLTAAGVAAALASFIVLVGLSRGLERAWIDGMRDQGIDMLAMQKRTIDILTATLDESLATRIAAVPGVAETCGELADLLELETGEVVVATGWGPGCFLWRSQAVLEGRLPRADELYTAAIGQAVAEVLHKKVGDRIGLGERSFVVSGIFGTGDPRWTRFLILPLSALQDLLGKRGKVTIVAMRLLHPERTDERRAVEARLDAAFPDMAFSLVEAVADRDTVLRALRRLAWATSAIALTMALVLVINTLLMSVMERAREMGTLSAVGWSDERIVTLVVVEGLVLTTVGSLLGSAVGVGGLEWLARLPAVAGAMKPTIGLRVVAEAAVATTLLALVGCGYPAWRTARLNPVDALREE